MCFLLDLQVLFPDVERAEWLNQVIITWLLSFRYGTDKYQVSTELT